MPLQKCFIFKKTYVKDAFDKYSSLINFTPYCWAAYKKNEESDAFIKLTKDWLLRIGE